MKQFKNWRSRRACEVRKKVPRWPAGLSANIKSRVVLFINQAHENFISRRLTAPDRSISTSNTGHAFTLWVIRHWKLWKSYFFWCVKASLNLLPEGFSALRNKSIHSCRLLWSLGMGFICHRSTAHQTTTALAYKRESAGFETNLGFGGISDAWIQKLAYSVPPINLMCKTLPCPSLPLRSLWI